MVYDNCINQKVAAAADALKKFGADVKCVESGKAALEMLQLPHKFDACFMDIQMLEMDGYCFFSCFIIHIIVIVILKLWMKVMTLYIGFITSL